MIRFLADACLAHYIVSGCLRREPSMDFKSAVSAGLFFQQLRRSDSAAKARSTGLFHTLWRRGLTRIIHDAGGEEAIAGCPEGNTGE